MRRRCSISPLKHTLPCAPGQCHVLRRPPYAIIVKAQGRSCRAWPNCSFLDCPQGAFMLNKRTFEEKMRVY